MLFNGSLRAASRTPRLLSAKIPLFFDVWASYPSHGAFPLILRLLKCSD
jgi:hypothetical protein